MKDNGLLKYYRTLGSKDGLLHIDGIDKKDGMECLEDFKSIQTLEECNCGKKFYVKKCSPKEQPAEVLLSQIYAQAGFNTAIYFPVDNDRVISNDVGAKGETAEKFFLRKIVEDKIKESPRDAECLLKMKAIEPFSLGICYVPRYIKYLTHECAGQYFEMRGFDVAAKNPDRHLGNYFFETNENDLASQLNVFDFGYSALVQNRVVEPNYCSLIGGQVSCPKEMLLWQLTQDSDIAGYLDEKQLTEKIGAVDVVATAKDIESTIGYKCDETYVDNIAYSFDQTAEDLLALTK